VQGADPGTARAAMSTKPRLRSDVDRVQGPCAQTRFSAMLADHNNRKSDMKVSLTLALLSLTAPFAVAQHATDPPPKNVEVHKSKGPEKALMNVGPGGKAIVVAPGRDAPGGPSPGLQKNMKFPDPEKPLKRETTTVQVEKSSKSTDAKTAR
jgi:hypothetical protein